MPEGAGKGVGRINSFQFIRPLKQLQLNLISKLYEKNGSLELLGFG